MAINVFLSVGKTSTHQQEEFVAAFEQYMRSNGLITHAVGRSDFTSQQPLKHIEQLMKQCSGTVIIAFERIHIQDGIYRRGSGSEEPIKNQNLPTVWNQVEAAMAYILGHPLLVIIENGIRSEGLLERGYDWYVQWVNLDGKTLTNCEFTGVFADWKKRVEEFNINGKNVSLGTGREVDIDKLTIGKIIETLKPEQLWKIGIAVIGVISAVAALAFKFGTLYSGKP